MFALSRDDAQVLAGVFAEVCKNSNKNVSYSHVSIALSPYIAVNNVKYKCKTIAWPTPSKQVYMLSFISHFLLYHNIRK